MRAGGEGDVGDGHLAGVDVGPADRRGRGDLRVGEQRVLDDRGVDVVAAADDQVLGPAGEADEAVLVDAAEVAGVEPAVDQLAHAVQHVAVLVAAGDVAGEHGGPADRQHAGLRRRAGPPSCRRPSTRTAFSCW